LEVDGDAGDLRPLAVDQDDCFREDDLEEDEDEDEEELLLLLLLLLLLPLSFLRTLLDLFWFVMDKGRVVTVGFDDGGGSDGVFLVYAVVFLCCARITVFFLRSRDASLRFVDVGIAVDEDKSLDGGPRMNAEHESILS